MGSVGIRELKQNASKVVARAAAGETVTITERGRPVAQLTPLPTSRLDELIAAGLVIPATRGPHDLPEPVVVPGLGQDALLDDLLAERHEDWR